MIKLRWSSVFSLPTHKHGLHAEQTLDSTIYARGLKMSGILLDPKLRSKVLTANIYPSNKGKLCQQSANMKMPLTEFK